MNRPADVLFENAGFIVSHVFSNVGYDECALLDQLCTLVRAEEYDVEKKKGVFGFNIHFDSSRLYLIGYKYRHESKLYVEFDGSTPRDVLVMVKGLVEGGSMSDNIQNESKRIHFRKYAHREDLYDYDCRIRGEFMAHAARVIGSSSRVLRYLVLRRARVDDAYTSMILTRIIDVFLARCGRACRSA